MMTSMLLTAWLVATPHVSGSDCGVPGLDAAAVERMAAAAPSGTRVELIVLPCTATTATVTVRLHTTGGTVRAREVPLADVAPETRSRTLALVIEEVAREPEGAAEPPVVVVSRGDALHGELAAVGTLGSAYGGGRAPLGGRVHGALVMGAHALGLDLGASWTRTETEGGDVNLIFLEDGVSSGAARRSPASLTVLSLGVGYQYGVDLRALRLSAGPVVTAGLGLARSLGATAPGVETVDHDVFLLAVGVRGRVGLRLAERWRALLEVDVTGHLRGVDVRSSA